MRADTVYKRAFNGLLDLLRNSRRGTPVPSENQLREMLGVSRTTIRKALTELSNRSLVSKDGRHRFVEARPRSADYFPKLETVATFEQVESRFMEWILRGDAKPGSAINELELARQFGVATGGIREFLNRFRRFGLTEKRPNSGWLFKGFTEDFALELFDIREMFELRSARSFRNLTADSPLWAKLDEVEREHRALLRDIDKRFHDFSDLDNRFHRLVNAAAPNRFIDDFYDIISLIFHYHYQWNKHDERQRNAVAIKEHLAYIKALKSKNLQTIEIACRRHLVSAKTTMTRAFLSG